MEEKKVEEKQGKDDNLEENIEFDDELSQYAKNDLDDPKEAWRFEEFTCDTVEEAIAEFKRRGIL